MIWGWRSYWLFLSQIYTVFALMASTGVEEITRTSALSLTSRLDPPSLLAFIVLPANHINATEAIFVLAPSPQQQLLFPPRDLSVLAVVSNSVTIQWRHMSGRNIIMVCVCMCVCYNRLHWEPVWVSDACEFVELSMHCSWSLGWNCCGNLCSFPGLYPNGTRSLDGVHTHCEGLQF